MDAFHVKQSISAPRRSQRLSALLALGLSLFLVACANEAPARGWPAPVVVSNAGDELLVIVQSAPGTLTELAITSTGTAERWSFPAKDDKTRLRLLYALRSGEELCVCDLAQVLGLSVSATSYQLQAMRRARVVRYRTEGTTIRIDGEVDAGGPAPELHRVAEELLGIVADEFSVDGGDGRRSFRLVKRGQRLDGGG